MHTQDGYESGQNSKPDKNANFGALSYMLIAVTCFSLIPLGVNLAGGPQSPFLFNVLFRLGAAAGCIFFLLHYRQYVFTAAVISLVWKGIKKPPGNILLLGTIISSLDFALLAWAARLLDITVATILFEIWPVFMILFAARLFKDVDRYRRVNITVVSLTLLSLAGFVFAIASQTTTTDGIDSFFAVLWESRNGIGLVLAAIVVTTLITSAWKWGVLLDSQAKTEPNDRSLQLMFVIVAFLIASIISSIGSAGVALAEGETLTPAGALLAFLFGAILTVGNVVWGKANFVTDNLGINALNYAIPILSLIWLVSVPVILRYLGVQGVPQAEVVRWDYLVLGAAAIVTANLLINFEAEIRWGFKALLISLGLYGAIAYLRDGMFTFLEIHSWSWNEAGFFESITLAATVFTLLLAFRVARLVSRTGEEDTRTFLVYRKLELLARRGMVSPQVCEHILEIDKANNNSAAEKEAYDHARALIAEVDPLALNDADAQLLSDAESQLDSLARSKQIDIHLGEQFALWIFGGITIGLALFSLPSNAEQGWTRLIVDLFSMLISAVVTFLLFHIRDLQRERDQEKFSQISKSLNNRRYIAVRFLDTEQRTFDQWLSLVVGGTIVLTFAALFAQKWLG